MKKILLTLIVCIISIGAFAQGSGPKPADIVNGVTSREDVRLKIDWGADEADYATGLAEGNTTLIRNPFGTYTLAGATTLSLNSQTLIYQGVSIDNTEDYVIAIDDATGLISRRAVSSFGGGGTYTFSNGLTEVAGAVTLEGSLTKPTSLELAGNQISLWNTATSTGLILSPTGLSMGEALSAEITLSFSSDYVELLSNSTILNLGSAGTNWTGIAIDETEGYLLAIDDATGLISRRSAAGLGGGGGGDLLSSNNLSDLANISTARTNLSVYSTAETYSTAQTDALFNGVTLSSVSGASYFLDGAGNYNQITKIGGYSYAANVLAPTLSEDQYALVWDQTSGSYKLAEQSASGVSDHTLLTNIGTKSHAVLESDITDIYARLNDTVSISDELHSFPFGAGGGNPTDTAAFQVDTYLGGWYVAGDTVVADTMHMECFGTGGDVTARLFYGTSLASGTAMMTANQVTTATGQETISTWTATDVPPGNRIWMEVTAVGTTKPILLFCDLVYHKK